MCDINITVQFILGKINSSPKTAIILGTGLSSLAEELNDRIKIPYKEIPGFVVSTAPTHAGQLVSGTFDGIPILIFQGRVHYYEGYTMQQITYPIRVLEKLGIKNIIITNAAGSLKEELRPGDAVVISDHINLMGNNPLIGVHNDEWGERFPSLNEAYDKDLISFVRKISDSKNYDFKTGVYAAVHGPSLETKSECLMIQKMGADLVGMSTVPEVIVANQSGLKVLGISIVTNYSNIFHSQAHSMEEINHNAQQGAEKLLIILNEILKIM